MRSSLGFVFLCLLSCAFKDDEVDLVVHNAIIYTVDGTFSVVEAMAIDSGKVKAIGPERDILNKYRSKATLDAGGKVIYPGFIDSHCHFIGYAKGKLEVDLTGTQSWYECLDRIQAYAQDNPEGWITGRGWDQNDWPEKAFPDNKRLSELFPDRPVAVNRVDGHASLANEKAFEVAKIKKTDRVLGGEYHLDDEGNLSGMLIDNAMIKLNSVIPEPDDAQLMKALKKAEEDCFAKGLTTVDDAGLDTIQVNFIRRLQRENELKMRIYAMLSADDGGMEYMKKGPVSEDRMTVRSIKIYADGALGSRGAAMKRDYHDHPGHKGALLHQPVFFKQWAALADLYGFQLNTHCIGDKANQIVLAVYNDQLGGANDKRWRIEHAQVVTDGDLERFKRSNILPSVQPTHATSDMAWAEERLGEERMYGAYAYASLSSQNGLVLLGTDFPIEDIDPLLTFYAAVFRKNANGEPINGWRMEEALTREQALMGMTIWGAIGNFEETRKGSLEPGKVADFVIMDRDIMTCGEDEVLRAKVLATYLNGEKVWAP